MRQRLIIPLFAFSFLAGCNDTVRTCQFLDRGFLYPSPVMAADLLPAEIKDDTAIRRARQRVEACYNSRPSERAEAIGPFQARRGRSGRIYLLYISVANTDTVVGFVLDANLNPLFAVEGASPSDFWNRSFQTSAIGGKRKGSFAAVGLDSCHGDAMNSHASYARSRWCHRSRWAQI